jgi:ABC-type branched-subunit amino acid transport system ATPase component
MAGGDGPARPVTPGRVLDAAIALGVALLGLADGLGAAAREDHEAALTTAALVMMGVVLFPRRRFPGTVLALIAAAGAGLVGLVVRQQLAARTEHIAALAERAELIAAQQDERARRATLAAARALASRPEIVFADEPTGNLDSRASAEVLGLLRASVREFGQTVVMVTHDPIAASYADQVVFLADGRIAGGLARPTPESVLDAMKKLGE